MLEKLILPDIVLVKTCSACPEQYDAVLHNEVIGYLRLRHGYFAVECPDVCGQEVYSAEPRGDGEFFDDERQYHLDEAKRAIAKWYVNKVKQEKNQMSEVSIFKDKDAVVVASGARELSPLAKSLVASSITRRIQTNTNGTFKRMLNGETMGNIVRGEINVIVVDALPKVSRTYYAKQYDPSAEATLPDCWSNLGDKPEAMASNKQNENCADCPQNIKGSGGAERRACRFQRRIAVMLEGDDSGDVYQFNVPSKSLFGKGAGNVHPFESYTKFLAGNGHSIDAVVTNIAYDLNADTMQLLFTPVRGISDEEYALVREAQAKPETHALTMLTVFQASKKPDGAAPAQAKAAVQRSDEPDDEPGEPQRRTAKKTVAPAPAKKDLSAAVDAWSKD